MADLLYVFGRRNVAKQRVWLVLLLGCGPLFFLFPQAPPTAAGSASSRIASAERLPAWVLYELARSEMADRNFGVALQRFGEALAEQPIFPEARAGMAAVFAAEGDYLLAERYYRQSISQARQLNVPDQEVLIRHELATLLRRQGRTADYRRELEAVVQRDPVFTGTHNDWQRRAMYDLLLDRGLDRVLVLYRLSHPEVTGAHLELGRWDLDQGDERAVEHLLFATVELVSRTVSAVINRRYNFQFTSLSELFAVVESVPNARSFVQDERLTDLLLDLADALRTLSDRRGALRAAEIEETVRRQIAGR